MFEQGVQGLGADPLLGFELAGAGVRVRGLDPGWRWSLRADPADRDRLERAWGAPLPAGMLTASSGGQHHALRLGPDEWYLLAETGGAADELLALPQYPAFSLVDVGARPAAFEISGEAGRALLNAGCPLDLSAAAFPAGCCTRSVFGKAEIILWRPDAAPAWRLEVWRSLAPYLKRYLTQAITDL